MPPFWTFKGVIVKNMVEGAPGAEFNLTENGWPTDLSWFKFCKLFVAQMKLRGLKKALLLVDGCGVHFHLPSILLLRENNVRLWCLPPGCTHILQPCDVGYFPLLTAWLVRYNSEKRGVVLEKELASVVHAFNLDLEAKRIMSPPGAMVNTWRSCGLVPLVDPLTHFDDSVWIKADIALGINAESAPVIASKAFKAESLDRAVDSNLASKDPAVTDALVKHVKKGKFDLSACGLTDDAVVKTLMEKESLKVEDAQAVADRKEERRLRAEEKQWEKDQKDVYNALVEWDKAEKMKLKLAKAAPPPAAAAPAPPPPLPAAPLPPILLGRGGRGASRKRAREFGT